MSESPEMIALARQYMVFGVNLTDGLILAHREMEMRREFFEHQEEYVKRAKPKPDDEFFKKRKVNELKRRARVFDENKRKVKDLWAKMPPLPHLDKGILSELAKMFGFNPRTLEARYRRGNFGFPRIVIYPMGVKSGMAEVINQFYNAWRMGIKIY